MSLTDFTNLLQIILGIIALIIFVMIAVKTKRFNPLKEDFNAQIFLPIIIMVFAESLEHSNESISAAIGSYIPYVYLLSGILIFVLVFRKARQSELI